MCSDCLSCMISPALSSSDLPNSSPSPRRSEHSPSSISHFYIPRAAASLSSLLPDRFRLLLLEFKPGYFLLRCCCGGWFCCYFAVTIYCYSHCSCSDLLSPIPVLGQGTVPPLWFDRESWGTDRGIEGHRPRTLLPTLTGLVLKRLEIFSQI